ncbi:MAG: methionine--tRNA ligase [Dehalococcoidales bacterium]|jgi:methionyl-tRNA synthetase|nr:methionine--tRNA ligase [Dehalococcoidales bacterium]
MTERIFIGVAWPYASGSRHLGHAAGAYVPADIFARFHRTRGNEVLMVSGSDMHGTPITIKAEQEGKTPEEVATRYHNQFVETFDKLGISFDLFTHTNTPNHIEVTQDFFLKLYEKGYIYKDSVLQAWCPRCGRFLTDRYIEGTCPYCKFGEARGDQCDQCGKPMNPVELIAARCRLCGETPEFKTSEHFFLKLSAFQDKLIEWVKPKTFWRPNVYHFTLHYLEEGLKDRAITRDMEWGVPVPIPGYDGKRIYVWFDAVIGYLSASKEWARKTGDPEKWRLFWENEQAKAYYFIGKDNIVFHTIIWPAMLMGYGGLNLPFDVPANEFLTFEMKKFSTSRNWAVWLPDYLSRYSADPLRYLLSINMPETTDTDFSWREFVRRNNDELVATYGNLVHRVLTFTCRNYNCAVPSPANLDDIDQQMLGRAEETLKIMDVLISRCRFKDAIKTAMNLAQEANRYLDEKSPWKIIKQDRQLAGNSLYVALSVLSCLRTAFYPFLPFSSQKLHEYLGYTGKIETLGWKFNPPPAGQKLLVPQPLFTKLEDKIIDEENARLEHTIEE